jgi:hypothetical protein
MAAVDGLAVRLVLPFALRRQRRGSRWKIGSGQGGVDSCRRGQAALTLALSNSGTSSVSKYSGSSVVSAI